MNRQDSSELIQQPVGQNLYVDSESSEPDTSQGDRWKSATSSLSSTVLKYRYEHGRRWHAFDENAYCLPNDETEMERLDIQDYVWRLTLNGKLHVSPISKEVRHVLDVGTGTGQWAMEFADEHPSSHVIGTDLSPIQPEYTPPNCYFMIDNAENSWVFSHKFDFIHSRMLVMGIHDYPQYFKQIWDNLEPGGWMEIKEPQFPIGVHDDTVPSSSPLLVWSQHVREACAKAGIDTMCTERFVDQINDQGFVNVKAYPVKWAVGPWPKGNLEKNIGWLTLENTKQFISAIALNLFTKHLGWSTGQVELFLIDVRRDLSDRNKHYFWQL
ncbi:MAG: hypothetical protein Q9160_005911 [Pyrenula sp. 1 TL-2023]